MKPLVKKMLTAVLCASTLTAPLFLSGCSFSKIANGVQQGAQKASQKDIQVFNQYIEAVGNFNSGTVRFGYAINPSIQKLREGQHLSSFMAPKFDSLQQKLQAAKDAGIPYDDMKEPLDNVLAVLKDIVPVANELDTYYQTNSYQADNYAKEQQLGPKYVQLYDQFAANQELQGIMDVSSSITSPDYNSAKNHLNTTIGRIRTFLGDQTADHYNDMIESYNSFIGSVNRLDMNKLDK